MPNGKNPWEDDYTETPTDGVATDKETTDEVAKPWEESYTGEEPVKKKEPTEPEEPTTGLDEFGLELPSISQPEQIISDRLLPQIDPAQEFARLQSNIQTEQERQAKIVKAQKGTELEAKKDQLIPMRDNIQFELDENEKEKRRLNAMLESFSLTTEDKDHVQAQLDKVDDLDIALEDRLGELSIASNKLSGELTELMGAAHYQKEQNFKAFTQDIPVFKMTTADVDDPLKDMDWFERHQAELVDQTTRQNRVMTEDLKVELATEQAIEIFKTNGIYKKTNPDYLENRKKFLDSLDKQGVSGYKLYRAMGMDYVPTAQESLDNDLKKMEAQIKGTIPKLQLLTLSVYEDVFGEEKAREFYVNEAGTFDEVRRSSLAKLEELGKVGELPTIGIMDDIEGEGGLAVASHVVAGLFNVISAVAPSLLTGIGTLGATAVTDQMGGALHTFNKAKADHLGISLQQLYDNGLNEHELAYQVGGFAATLEAFGMKGTMNAMTKSLTKKGGYQIAASMFLESSKEGITEVIQLGMETYLTATAEGKDEQEASELAWDKMLSEEGLKTLVTGALGSGIMGAGGAAFNEKSTKLNKRKAELEVEKAKAKKEGRDGDIELYIASIEKVDSEIETLANDQANNIVEKSENETTVEVAKAEITRLEGEMNKEGITPAGKEALQTEVDAIKKTIKPIEDAIQEPSPEKVPVQPEAERGEEVRREDAERKEVTEEVKEEKIEERVVTEPEPEVKVEKFDGKDFSKGKKSEDIAKEEGLKFATPEEAEQHISEKSENPLEIAESYERSVRTAPEAEQKGYKTQVIEDANIKITPEEFAQYSDPKLASKRTDAKFIDSKRVTPLDVKLAEISEVAGIEITPDDFAAHISDFEVKAEAPKEVGILAKLKDRFKEITGKLLTPKLAKEVTTKAVKEIETRKKAEAIGKEFEEQKAGEKAADEAKGKPKEAEPQPISDFSGIKKKLVPPEVQARVDWNKVSDKEMMDMGKTMVEKGHIIPKDIISDVQIEPRALQPQEVSALIYYKATLDKDLNAAFASKAEKAADGKGTAIEDAKIQALQGEIYDYQAMSLITAQQQSLAFRLRQYLRDSNTFDVVKAINQYKAANDGFIPKKVEAQFKEHDKKIKELVTRINDLEAERADKIEAESFQNIVDDVARKDKKGKAKAKAKDRGKRVGKVRARAFRNKYKKKPVTFTIKDDKGNDVDVNLTQRGFDQGAMVDLIASAIEKAGSIQDAVNLVVAKVKDQDWYKNLSGANKKSVNKQIGDLINEDFDVVDAEITLDDKGTLNIPAKLIRKHVAEGVRDIGKLTDIIHQQAIADGLDVSKREVRDAITGYGKTVNLSKDEISIETRKIKRIGKLISALEDAKNKKRPLRSGLQRDKITDKERLLKAELNELLKDIPVADKETAVAWKSALDGMKSRLKNRIKDLEGQIKSGKKPKAKKGIKLDIEAKGLQEQRDALQEQLDAIVGKPEMSEEQRVNNAIKSAERSLKEIESQIEKGGLIKQAKEKLKPTPELKAARKKRDDAKADLDALRDVRGIADHLINTKTKKRLEKQRKEYERMLAEKDYAKKEPKISTLIDDALLKARAQVEKVKAKVAEEQQKIVEANKTWPEMGKDFVAEVFNALPRVFIASMDLSAMGVQGFLKMYRHPIESLKGLATSVHQMFSQTAHDNMLDKLKAMPSYPAMKKAGLALLESDFTLTVKEEQFLGNWINHIWNAPANLVEWVAGENAISKGWKAFNPYKASERAYAGFLNHIRVVSFERFAKGLEHEGITPQNNPEAYKRAAKVVNASTGRGSLGDFEGANTLLQGLFFSVRRLASTVQILEPIYSLSMPKEVRKMALYDLIISLGGIATATILAQMAFGEEEDEDEFLDPNSSNFFKIRIEGKDGSFTTLGLAGPLHSLVTTVSRATTGKFRSATTGEIQYLGERGPMADINSRMDVIKAFFWNKKAPGIAIIEKILDQRKGRELDEDEFWRETMLPIWSQDLSEVFEDHEGSAATLLTALNLLGISSQHFQLTKKQRRAKRKANKRSDRNKIRHEKYLEKLEKKKKRKEKKKK